MIVKHSNRKYSNRWRLWCFTRQQEDSQCVGQKTRGEHSPPLVKLLEKGRSKWTGVIFGNLDVLLSLPEDKHTGNAHRAYYNATELGWICFLKAGGTLCLSLCERVRDTASAENKCRVPRIQAGGEKSEEMDELDSDPRLFCGSYITFYCTHFLPNVTNIKYSILPAKPPFLPFSQRHW